MNVLKIIDLINTFLPEIAILMALGYYGFQVGKNNFMNYTVAIGLLLATGILWGFFAAPKSPYRLALPTRTLFALTLFSITVFLLYSTNHPTLTMIFATLATVSLIAAYLSMETIVTT